MIIWNIMMMTKIKKKIELALQKNMFEEADELLAQVLSKIEDFPTEMLLEILDACLRFQDKLPNLRKLQKLI